MSSDSVTAIARGTGPSRWRIPRGAIVYLGFVLLFVVFAIVLRDSGFLTVDNQLNILRQTAFVSVMAFGTTFALSAGEIDLSIGQVVALSAMVTAVLLRDASAIVAVPAGLLVGVGVGLANGLLTTGLRVPSFLITLGTAGVVGGLSDGSPASSLYPFSTRPIPPSSDPETLGRSEPVPVDAGRARHRPSRVPQDDLRPPGPRHRRQPHRGPLLGDQRRAHPDRKPGHLLDLGGPGRSANVGRLHSARYTLGETDLLTVIAAAVIGGTSIAGGRGSIVGALVGSLLMGVLNNGLILMGLSVTEQMIARGAIIIVAVALSLREASKD